MSQAKEIWLRFFAACDLPPRIGQGYAQSFVDQRIQPYMLKELTKDELKELGIRALGDQLAVMRYIKKTDGANNELFKSIERPCSTTSSSSRPHKTRQETRTAPSVSQRSHVIQKKRPSIPTVLPRMVQREPVTGLRSDALLQTRLDRFKHQSRQPVQEVRVISRPAPRYQDEYIEAERRPIVVRRPQFSRQNHRITGPRFHN